MSNKTLPAEIDHGRRGRIRVVSDWNTDREIPSRQVWVEMWIRGQLVGTSSGNLVEDIQQVEINSEAPAGLSGALMPEEVRFVKYIMEEFEGRNS